jgi:hypothetical protein
MPNYKVIATGREDVGKHPETVREVAFELWWLECSRNPKQVAEKLATDKVWREQAGLAEGDKGPSDDSIRRWAVSEGWSDLAYERMAAAMPHMLAKGSVELIYSFPEAVRTLTNVAAGRGSNEDGKPNSSDRIAADNAFRVVQLIAGEQLSQLAKPVVGKAVDLSRIDEMSMEQLNALERGGL